MAMSPVTNSAFISYDQEPSLLSSNTDLNLGTFTNAGANSNLSFSLAQRQRPIAAVFCSSDSVRLGLQ